MYVCNRFTLLYTWNQCNIVNQFYPNTFLNNKQTLLRKKNNKFWGCTPETRGGGQEDQPHVQGAKTARAQEGLEELSHVEGQEGRQWGDTPCPR